MNTQQRALLKHFSLVLKKRAQSEEPNHPSIDAGILKHLTRKDMIEIISNKYQGTIPKDIPLTQMENEELLEVIGDDLYVISYLTGRWSRGLNQHERETTNSADDKKATKDETTKASSLSSNKK